MFATQAMVCRNYILWTNYFMQKNTQLFQLFLRLKIVKCGAWFIKIDNLHQSLYDKMSNSNILDPDKQNRQLLSRLWDGLKRKGDGKCYCPCIQWGVFKRRRIKITTVRKHCREHGHTKGGHEYRPFVIFALYMFLYWLFL